MSPPVADLRLTAEAAARRAGELIRARWSQPRSVTNKGFRDLVTDTDLAAQQAVADLIRPRFPEHGFLAEEEDSDLPAAGGPVTWIIDPLDGTSNFSHEIPIFCVSVAAAVAGEIMAGAIYDPFRDELFSAAQGQGSRLNDRPVSVTGRRNLTDTIIGFDWSRDRYRRQAVLDSLGVLAHQVHTVRAIGSAALALAWVAAGRLDGYFNFSVAAWDVAAGAVLIREAGGRVTTADGTAWVPGTGYHDCLASNDHCHRALKATLRLRPPI